MKSKGQPSFDHLSNDFRSVCESVYEWLMRPVGHTAFQSVTPLHSSLGTTTGLVRIENQDRALVARYRGNSSTEAFCLYVVADGLGGMSDGASCASLACAHLLTRLLESKREQRAVDRLSTAVEFASRQVNRAYRESGGTTLSVVLATNQEVVSVNVGDSRIYIHLGSGTLKQMSVDDTIASRLAKIQNRSLSSFDEQPYGAHLAQFIGQQGAVEPQPVDVSGVWLAHSKSKIAAADENSISGVLICTDGAYKAHSVLAAVVRAAPSPRDVIIRLLRMAEWTGGVDNATVLYLKSFEEFIKVPDRPVRVPKLEIWDTHGELTVDMARSIAQREGPEKAKEKPKPKKRRRTKGKKKTAASLNGDHKESDEGKKKDKEKASKQGELSIEVTEADK